MDLFTTAMSSFGNFTAPFYNYASSELNKGIHNTDASNIAISILAGITFGTSLSTFQKNKLVGSIQAGVSFLILRESDLPIKDRALIFMTFGLLSYIFSDSCCTLRKKNLPSFN